MRSLGVVRANRMKRQKEDMAVPNRRDAYAAQKKQISYNEILQLTVEQTTPLQNADGSFPFLSGFDRF